LPTHISQTRFDISTTPSKQIFIPPHLHPNTPGPFSTPISLPKPANPPPPQNSDPLLNEIYNYYGTLAAQPDIQTLFSSFVSAAQTDIVNYVAASPTQVLAELPGLLSIMNPIFAQETPFYAELLASEASIEAAITSIVSADQAEPTKVVGDLMGYMGSLMA